MDWLALAAAVGVAALAGVGVAARCTAVCGRQAVVLAAEGRTGSGVGGVHTGVATPTTSAQPGASSAVPTVCHRQPYTARPAACANASGGPCPTLGQLLLEGGAHPLRLSSCISKLRLLPCGIRVWNLLARSKVKGVQAIRGCRTGLLAATAERM